MPFGTARGAPGYRSRPRPTGPEFVNRSHVIVLNFPQSRGYARWLYAEAGRRDLLEPGACEPHTTSLMFVIGERMWFSKGSTANIKISTPEDLRLFRSWVLASANDCSRLEALGDNGGGS